MEIIVFAMIALIATLFSRGIFRYWINPLSAWSLPWAVVLGLFSLRLLPYEPVSDKTKLVIFLSLLGYALGCSILAFAVPLKRTSQLMINKKAGAIRGEGTFRLLSILGMTASVVLASLIVHRFGVAGALAGELRAFRHAGMAENLPVPLALMVYGLLPASSLSGARFAARNRLDLWDVLVFFSLGVFAILRGVRSVLLLWLILFSIGYVMTRQRRFGRKRVNRPIVTIVVALALVTLLFFGIYTWRGSANHQELRDMKYDRSLLDRLTRSAYIYISSSITNLDYFITTFRGPNTWGISLCYPITRQLAKISDLEPTLDQGFSSKRAPVVGGTNVYTLIRVIYLDFGLIGCILIPALLGFLINLTYKLFLKRGSPASLIILGYLGVTVIASPYEYMLYNTMYVVPFAVATLGALYEDRKMRGM